MPYTLAKFALWLISAAVAGFVVGWMLRGLRSGGSLRDGAEAASVVADGGEVQSLRERIAALEPVMAERDQLQAQLAKCREQAQSVRRAVAAEVLQTTDVFEPLADPATLESPARAERGRLATEVAAHVATIGDLRARLWNHEARIGELQDALAAQYAATAPPDPDLVAGAVMLGEKVRLNDLTVVEGIGPKIADLLLTNGIKTWWQLYQADPDHLRRVLAEAGPRFQVHDPAAWPEQAGMLARGEWQQFKLLADRLKGGRPGE